MIRKIQLNPRSIYLITNTWGVLSNVWQQQKFNTRNANSQTHAHINKKRRTYVKRHTSIGNNILDERFEKRLP